MTGHAAIEDSHGPALIVLTRSSAYYLANQVCVGVRDRRSGDCDARHVALGLHVAGARPTCVDPTDVRVLWPGTIRAGARLVLMGPGLEHVSEPVLGTEPLSAQRAAELNALGTPGVATAPSCVAARVPPRAGPASQPAESTASRSGISLRSSFIAWAASVFDRNSASAA
jgi:hypothetical protein